jgi:hypothetical protein
VAAWRSLRLIKAQEIDHDITPNIDSLTHEPLNLDTSVSEELDLPALARHGDRNHHSLSAVDKKLKGNPVLSERFTKVQEVLQCIHDYLLNLVALVKSL